MYYMFGFLFLVFAILLITCSEATILLCYFHLCAEDYHWWWRSFLTSGFTAIYFFFYCVHYYVSKLEIEGFASTILYFGYTIIMVFLFFLLTGQSPLNHNKLHIPLAVLCIPSFIGGVANVHFGMYCFMVIKFISSNNNSYISDEI